LVGKYFSTKTFKIQGWITHSWGYIKFSTHYTLTDCDLNTNIIAQSKLQEDNTE